MTIIKNDKPVVVKVTREGFELSDGQFYPHPVPLEKEELPTVQEFQEYYDHWFNLLLKKDNGRKTVNDI